MAILNTTQKKRDAWAAAGYLGTCRGGQYINVKFFGKGIGGVPKQAVDAYLALEQAMTATGYGTPASRWAYNFRKITGSSAPCTCSSYNGCSLHGFGIAVDIDPSLNPYTSKPFSWNDTKFTPKQIAAIEAIKNTKGEKVWNWGGRWTSSPRDYMHFEIQVDPNSLQIDWSTVAGVTPQPPVPPNPQPGDDEVEEVVKGIQRSLNAAGFNGANAKPLTVDGVWGPNTEHAHTTMAKRAAAASSGGTVDQTARTAAAKAQSKANANEARLNKYNLK